MSETGVLRSIADASPISITIGANAKSVIVGLAALIAITFAAPQVGFGLVAVYTAFKLGCAKKGLL